MMNRVTPYEHYLEAWSAVPDSERLVLLEQSISEDMQFLNQVKTRNGLADVAEHMAGFQIQMPAAWFRLNNMVGWGA